jgi:hypothetical protein
MSDLLLLAKREGTKFWRSEQLLYGPPSANYPLTQRVWKDLLSVLLRHLGEKVQTELNGAELVVKPEMEQPVRVTFDSAELAQRWRKTLTDRMRRCVAVSRTSSLRSCRDCLVAASQTVFGPASESTFSSYPGPLGNQVRRPYAESLARRRSRRNQNRTTRAIARFSPAVDH